MRKIHLPIWFLIFTIVYSKPSGKLNLSEVATENRFLVFIDEDGNERIEDLNTKVIEIDLNPSHITFYFYSRENPNEPLVISAENFDGNVPSEYFDPKRPTFFITHGYTQSHKSCEKIKDAILTVEDVNVFAIDWNYVSTQFYTVAVRYVPDVGKISSVVVKEIIDYYNIDYSLINLQGHSLGAHVAGAIGANLEGKVNSLLGTDPALPGIYKEDKVTCIDISDAQYVQIIHANGGILGYKENLGHADFHPNGGGMSQPGCGPDLFGTCAHKRATSLYIESILTGQFRSKKCDSYEDFKDGKCDDNEEAFMGGAILDKSIQGVFYLDTAESSPFALG